MDTQFFKAFILIIISIVGLSCQSPKASNSEKSVEPNSPEGQYQQYCATCHGVDLNGGNAQSLVDKVWQYGDGNWSVSQNIKFGISHVGMPSFEGILSDDEIKGIVNYLEKMESASGETKPTFSPELESIDYKIKTEVVAEGLNEPWSIAFINNNKALVTEKPGSLWILKDGKMLEKPVTGIPKVLFAGQGGLMDVAIDPEYKQNKWVYLSFSHEIEKRKGDERSPAMTKIVRGRINDNKWEDEETIFEAPHEKYRTTRHHYGCRIVFDPDGYLYFSIGERGLSKEAQDISLPNGKVHRIHRDGSIPVDNPFVGKEGAIKSIFSYGNRNIQGMSVHPETGKVWATEHGPMGGDELNLIAAGNNYGWPEITYGRNYNGTVITEFTHKEGMEQPNFYWKPSPALCGLDFYRGGLFAKWENKLLVGALKYEEVKLLSIEGERIIHEEVILKNAGRVRDVECGPDGAIYVLVNEPGSILKLTPSSVK